MEHISKRSISLVSVGSSINIQSNKYKFNEGDILFGKLRPYFHKVCFASFSGVCSTDILVIRPKEAKMLPFCLFAFFQDEVINYVTAGSGGTRMPRTNWNDLSSFPFLKPPTSLIEKFNVTVQPFLEKIKSNQTQTRTLTALRDTLLPKLMSGEVWVEINTTVKMEEA
ncbi:restriction endonuclease subunit S [Flagellimonas sp.]|uniref:restriction endonuclease subunit S n=1 Tax=Flagellimonas sp. TaxID=2058762 RepID=UPI003AB5F4AE